MKSGNMIRIILITLGVWIYGDLYSQNPNRVEQTKESRCATKSFCEDFYGDFDYKGQSSYGEFAPSDTLRSKIIVYAGQDYRIFSCGHKDLGDLQFKIIEPIKEFKTVIKDIKKEDVIEYEVDEYGSFKVDDQGEMIVKSKTVKYDTIYEKQTLLKENLIFDNMNNKNNSAYWDSTVKKTKRLIVEVVIPAGEESFKECVNIYIGRMVSANKKFSQY
ncbi:MAG: hypothetical protein A2046_06625 [Bacteroidetes bacterium GWA2_30_7]|nr:MAG: hypothetical protein A2046_06625 [Bacteroidetes bacterium GWA2_30_7]